MDELPGISVFYRDEAGAIFHTYSSYARGAEELISAYMLLDLTPKGRNETGRGNLMDWVKRHDEYEDSRRCRSPAAMDRTRLEAARTSPNPPDVFHDFWTLAYAAIDD